MGEVGNLFLPVALLGGLVVLLPWVFMPGSRLSQRRLSLVMLATALAAWALGAILLGFAQAGVSPDFGARFRQVPLSVTLDLLARSPRLALFWGPVLGLVWLVRAQEMNRRIGLTMRDPAAPLPATRETTPWAG